MEPMRDCHDCGARPGQCHQDGVFLQKPRPAIRPLVWLLARLSGIEILGH